MSLAYQSEVVCVNGGGALMGRHCIWMLGNVSSSTIATTLKNLGALYRKQGKHEAAEILEELSNRGRHNVRRLIQQLLFCGR